MKNSQKQNWGTHWNTVPGRWNRVEEVMTKAFHGASLVVFVDKNGILIGYREFWESDANHRRICKIVIEVPSDGERVKVSAPIRKRCFLCSLLMRNVLMRASVRTSFVMIHSIFIKLLVSFYFCI